jgi:NADP-dependent 3-hydroxy acid dehydrogenase YdfG
LLGTRVRVTDVQPGMVDTEFSLVRFGGDGARAASVYAGMTPLTAEDIARTIHWCASQPAHVNINRVEIMPVDQAFAPTAVHRAPR